MKPLRVVYMGTPEFAVPALEVLSASPHDVVGVFTNPDRPSGRGKRLTPSPVKRFAVDHSIPAFQPERVRRNAEALDTLCGWEPDVVVVTAYGQILPQTILDVPRLGCVNIHASLLPRHRGAAPLNWCIIRGDEETGVTTMLMEAGLDTGPMLLQERTPIGELETAGELHDRLAQIGAQMIVPTIEGLADGSIEPKRQDDTLATYAPMMSKETGRIDWTAPAEDVANLVRGVNPWPGAFATLSGDRIKIHLARVVAGSAAPGEVVDSDRRLVVACGEEAVEILRLQAPGARAMDAQAFLNGAEIALGARFS